MSLTEAIQQAIWFEINGKLHTSLPGVITKYNAQEVRAEVQPIIKKLYLDGEEVIYKPIVSVPVMFPRTKRFHLTFPLEKGDGVLLIFSERSIATWLKAGENYTTPQEPANTFSFALTDAMAIPGLFPFGEGSQIGSSGQLELVFDKVKITSNGKDFVIKSKDATVESDGDKVTVKAGQVDLGTPTPLDGVVTKSSICAFTGLPHPDASNVVFAQKV